MVGADRWPARFTVLAAHGRRYRSGRCQPWIRWCHLEPGGCRPLVGTLHCSRRAWPGATALV